MTESEKIEFLDSYKYLIMQIKGYSKELKRIRSIAIDISQKYSDMPHGTGKSSAKYEDKVEDFNIEFNDFVKLGENNDNSINNDLESAKQKRDMINKSINNIKNIRYKTILILWYINCLPLDEITDIMHKSDVRQLYKLRKSALKHFNI